MTKIPDIIPQLVKQFERNINEYRNPKYNETLIRVEFVNPFWKALGWDVDNEKGYAMAYRDVIHEDELKVGRSTRAPDYAFRVGGTRKFFLETKKPAVDLKRDPAPAFQLRRYAYSAKLALSVLTDFEEFTVYDCRIKPAIVDKPHVGRMMYYSFREYLEKWEEISAIFSREAVLQGNFDRFIQDKQGKRPRAEIDRDFLNDLDKWRIRLARNIALRNPDLSERELNYAVQLTIDRLIFLRMCEDRDIEQYETLMALLNGTSIYRRLVQLYYKADERYNSGLFHFNEKDGNNPDMLTPSLEIDDKILKQVVNELYYPKCPYEFSVLPVEVLGNAYEQFLGKRITLTSGHRARIEEKPEVRKAGGVYYTPKYIVDYIVKNTVGKLCENKTPADVSRFRVLDPACGSGSFLLGAFQYLLNWHLNWYKNEHERSGEIPTSPTAAGKRKRKSDPQAIFQGKGGEWYLTTAEKKRVLINNIYGVDIDANAVEVTKLSLLLKVLENETSETLNRQLGLWHERALPNLASNIKCGNSLIGTDFYEGQQTALFDEEQAMRINAFDWEREFPDIFEQGGFDAVIGNPPYFSVSTLERSQIKLLRNSYQTFENTTDIYCLFFEKSLEILKNHGMLSFITSNQWLQTKYGIPLRKFFVDNSNPELLINFGGVKIFHGATVDTSILILKKSKFKNFLAACHFENDFEKHDSIEEYFSKNSLILNNLTDKKWTIVRPYIAELKNKINEKCKKLKNWDIKINRGLLTGYNKAFIIDSSTKDNLIKKSNNSGNIIKPILRGRDVHKYSVKWAELWLILTKNGIDVKDYLSIYKHLKSFGEKIKKRADQGENWWNLRACSYYNLFEQKKIIYPETTVRRSEFYYDEDGYYIDKTCFMITGENLKFLNGVLSSKLIEWYLESELRLLGKRSIQYSKRFMEAVPIPQLSKHNYSISKDIEKKVDLILNLKRKFSNAREPQIRIKLQRQIDTTDRQIDNLVYQLYGLTDEEIKIVEEST